MRIKNVLLMSLFLSISLTNEVFAKEVRLQCKGIHASEFVLGVFGLKCISPEFSGKTVVFKMNGVGVGISYGGSNPSLICNLTESDINTLNLLENNRSQTLNWSGTYRSAALGMGYETASLQSKTSGSNCRLSGRTGKALGAQAIIGEVEVYSLR